MKVPMVYREKTSFLGSVKHVHRWSFGCPIERGGNCLVKMRKALPWPHHIHFKGLVWFMVFNATFDYIKSYRGSQFYWQMKPEYCWKGVTRMFPSNFVNIDVQNVTVLFFQFYIDYWNSFVCLLFSLMFLSKT